MRAGVANPQQMSIRILQRSISVFLYRFADSFMHGKRMLKIVAQSCMHREFLKNIATTVITRRTVESNIIEALESNLQR